MIYDTPSETDGTEAIEPLTMKPEARLERVDSALDREKLDAFRRNFTTRVEPVDGVYGVREVDKGNGLIVRTTKTSDGHYLREYYQDGKIAQRRVTEGNRVVSTTYYDANGTDYLTTTSKMTNNKAEVKYKLKPNATIEKNRFTAVTDELGRPILSRMTDIQCRQEGVERLKLDDALRNKSYKPNDHRGHLIPDWFGGPATRENVVPQLNKVNQQRIARVEKIAAKLANEGHKVDYEIRTRYVGTSERPSSFEPRIIVDGKEYTDLPDDLKKIFNDASSSTVRHKLTTVGERLGAIHELGRHSGVVAAGLAFSMSATDNVTAFLDGEITAEEMINDIVGETAMAGLIGQGTTLIGETIARSMSSSANALISNVGRTCLPAAVVAFGVESFGDISDFSQGAIGADELAYNLGDHVAGVAGGFAGGALGGAALGSIAGPAGTLAGGVIGGVVGCALSSEIYATAVEIGAEGAEAIGSQITQLSNQTIEMIGNVAPEQASIASQAFSDFFAANRLPFSG